MRYLSILRINVVGFGIAHVIMHLVLFNYRVCIMLGVSIWQLLILIVFIPLAFLPSIIALKKNHPYKVPIILINVLGGLLWGAGWLISLIWCFIVPEKKVASMTSIADEIEKLHSLKEKGVISEDEFNIKKKELMRL